jgi:RNA-directed DNA polymerase
VARPVERKFLGFSFSHNKEPKRRIAPKVLLRCKQKIRELTRRTRGISLEQMLKELTAYLRGWKSYFGFCQTPSLLKALDKWIRHRLRSMIWKQWKRGKQRRYGKLRQRGARQALAVQTACSPHGPWPLNRPMRTRMSGGVARESGRPLPLCRFWSCSGLNSLSATFTKYRFCRKLSCK